MLPASAVRFPNEGYAVMQEDWAVMVFLFMFIGLVAGPWMLGVLLVFGSTGSTWFP